MERLLHECADKDGAHAGWMMFCPACQCCHLFDKRWKFNGNMDAPTFTPSMLARWEEAEPPVTAENLEEFKQNPWPQTKVKKVCHSFVTDGKIRYLGDCTHALKGQTVPMEKF